jgi:hypothetical protein
VQRALKFNRAEVAIRATAASPRADIASRKQTFVRESILGSAMRLFAERSYRVVTIDGPVPYDQ